jgi:hypothetical protein
VTPVRTLAAVCAATAVALAAVLGASGKSSTDVSGTVDNGLCPFPLQVVVRSSGVSGRAPATVLQFKFDGPTTVTLINEKTGRTATLATRGSYLAYPTGSVTFAGHQVWFWSTGKLVPFMSTNGPGSFVAPIFPLRSAHLKSSVIDPCALVAPAAPSTAPRTTASPWGLPAYQLSQIGYSGLTPILGALIRHDHAHLDVIVNGKHVTVPAGVGMAEPNDNGPCPVIPGQKWLGDCATRNFYTALVANAPLHTHSDNGLIHIESDRPGTFTLGQFFDEWGVRFDGKCVGGYCTESGKQLRVYLNGRRVTGDPRAIVLTNRQEIAVVYGGPGAFRSVPKRYTGGWPGAGCGGPHEISCNPRA